MTGEIVNWDGPDQYEDPPDHVEPQFGCPNCGETRVDYLDIQEDGEDEVFCLSCQEGYCIAEEPDVDMKREDHYLAGILPPK